MNVRDIMTARVESVSPATDLVIVARRMKDLNVGSLPVVEGERLLGIVTDRDIVTRVVAEGKQPKSVQVRTCLTPDPVTIAPDVDIKDASDVMARHQIRRLPVVEDGRLIGFISLGDLAVDTGKDKLVGDALEQISEPAAPRLREAGS